MKTITVDLSDCPCALGKFREWCGDKMLIWCGALEYGEDITVDPILSAPGSCPLREGPILIERVEGT